MLAAGEKCTLLLLILSFIVLEQNFCLVAFVLSSVKLYKYCSELQVKFFAVVLLVSISFLVKL